MEKKKKKLKKVEFFLWPDSVAIYSFVPTDLWEGCMAVRMVNSERENLHTNPKTCIHTHTHTNVSPQMYGITSTIHNFESRKNTWS